MINKIYSTFAKWRRHMIHMQDIITNPNGCHHVGHFELDQPQNLMSSFYNSRPTVHNPITFPDKELFRRWETGT